MTARTRPSTAPISSPDPWPPWRCPACRLPLAEDGRGATCAAGHALDRAREGYLHLLPAGRHRGRPPGDAAPMLTARRALFDAGHYAPVQRAVAAAIAAVAPRVVLDAGCGEGSWLGAVTAPVRLGIDVAKPGIRLAARRHRDCRWAVASSFQLPLDDASVDAVLCVFAPIAAAEFSRVLRPDGIAVLVTPGPDHLRGLTDLIYADVLPHAPLPAGEDTPLHHERVRYTLGLDRAEDIANLARMTPYWWKATAAQQAGILGRSALDVVVDMTITVRPRAA